MEKRERTERRDGIMNNRDFISQLAKKTGYDQQEVQRMVDSVTSTMGDAFQEGREMTVKGFGTFEIKKKLERVIVNPSTQQRMLVPPKLVLNFKPNTAWKRKIASGVPEGDNGEGGGK